MSYLDIMSKINIRIMNGSDFVLCKKTYIEREGQDKELLRAGYWYLLQNDENGAYISEGINKYYLYHKNENTDMFVSEHILSNDSEEIWVRLDILVNQYTQFKDILKTQFEKSSRKNILENLIIDGVTKDLFEFYAVYLKVSINEVTLVTKAMQDFYSDNNVVFQSLLYELDIDLTETNFYHK